MDLVEVYQVLGQERCKSLVRTVSISALKTFKVYEAIKVRSRLSRLNRMKLRAAAGKLWQRVADGDEDLARDLSQAVLVSNIPMIVEVLDYLEVEHDGNGFFSKDSDHSDKLSGDWPTRAFAHCKDRFDSDVVLLYINYLGWETDSLSAPFLGDDAASGTVPPNAPSDSREEEGAQTAE